MTQDPRLRLQYTTGVYLLGHPEQVVTDFAVRCPVCKKLLARQMTRPWTHDCPGCKTTVYADLQTAVTSA